MHFYAPDESGTIRLIAAKSKGQYESRTQTEDQGYRANSRFNS